MRRRARRLRTPWLPGASARRRHELAIVFALVFGSLGGGSRVAAGPVPFVTQPVITSVADGARSVFAADADGDGDLDAFSASRTDNAIVWYENEGGEGASWTARTISSVVTWARSVYAADVDGDGDIDALSASAYDDAIAWYENLGGDPPSWAASTISSVADMAYSVFAADVDGDGDLDVLSASVNDDAIAWYENEGGEGASWTARTISSVADGAWSVFAADVDGDGDLDALSASFNDDAIAWYENLGGDPPSWTASTISSAADSARSVYAVDVDGDGDLDALSASNDDDAIAWYENENGQGTSWTPRTISSAVDGASSVHAADVDGDGDLDALSTCLEDDEVAWYENLGGDPPSWTARTISSAADFAHSVYAADVDGDGDLDALSASFLDDEVAWHENRTIHRSAVLEQSAEISSDAYGARSVYAADIDGDGDVDAVSASSADDAIAWYENLGGDPPAWTASTISSVADAAYSSYAADVDGDGDLDVLSASRYDNSIAWYENETGDGASWTASTISSDAASARSVFAADVDGDGDVDVLSASFGDNSIAWYENVSGDGASWTASTIASDASLAVSVFAADVDGDGDVDVLSASLLDNAIAWYENVNGDGTSWASSTISSLVVGASSVYAADLDGDGDLDAVSASVGNDSVAWHENVSGDGTSWAASTISSAADFVVSVFAADLDGDGDLDVMSASFNSDEIAWYENEAGDATSWTPRTMTSAADGAWAVFAADVDDDGDLDALSASVNDDRIAWHANSGGQFALPTTTLAQGVLADSQEEAALQIDLEHRGRAGDSDVALDSVELRFEDGEGNLLDEPEANALIDKVELFLDDGTGMFEPGGDTLVEVVNELTLVSGVQSIPLAGGDPDVEVAFGESKRYFVVVTMTANASEQSPASFELIHLTEASSSGHDASTPAAPFTPLVPLRLEHLPNTETGPISTELSSASCKAPFELDLQSFFVDTAVVCEAGTTLTVGDGVTVSPTGDLTLRAGQRVRFVTTFSVEPGGGLEAEIDPLLQP